jgi:hypothetical protein
LKSGNVGKVKSGKVLNTKWRFRILDGEKPACTLLIPPLPPFFMH